MEKRLGLPLYWFEVLFNIVFSISLKKNAILAVMKPITYYSEANQNQTNQQKLICY